MTPCSNTQDKGLSTLTIAQPCWRDQPSLMHSATEDMQLEMWSM